MDFVALKYFIVTAQTQHITKAAQLLNVTQPALSASIRRLENDLGCQLFDRVGRGIKLNEFGKIFLEHATQLEEIMNTCLIKLSEARRSEAGFVRLACSKAPTNTQMIALLLSRGISLDARTVPRNWESELLNNSLDMVLTFGRSSLISLARSILCLYKVVVVAGREHPLARAGQVTAADLGHYPFCCNSAPHSLTYMAKEACEAQGFSPRITFQGRDTADMLNIIRGNEYLGLMVEAHLREDDGAVVLPVTDLNISQPFYLYWRKSDLQNSFLSFIRRNIIEFYQTVPPYRP